MLALIQHFDELPFRDAPVANCSKTGLGTRDEPRGDDG